MQVVAGIVLLQIGDPTKQAANFPSGDFRAEAQLWNPATVRATTQILIPENPEAISLGGRCLCHAMV
jgi:hypothetical protein